METIMSKLEKSEAYKSGYKTGYEWLTRGNNFKHPNSHGGYIPGGPATLRAHSYDKPEYKERVKQSEQDNKDWRNGWVDGINAYVKRHHLSYSEVTERF